MNSEFAAYYPDVPADSADTRDLARSESCTSNRVSETNSVALARQERVRESVEQLTDVSDEKLLARVGLGDRAALTLLFQRHAKKILHVARRILNDECEAEDLMQELFVFIFQKAKLFDPQKASAASWIIQMTYHRAIDRRRYLTSRHHYQSEEVREDRRETTRGQISIDELSGRALLEKLRKELSAEQLEVLELHFFEGYTFHEIAQRTGKVLGNVRHHYYRGIERLRAHVFPGKTDLK